MQPWLWLFWGSVAVTLFSYLGYPLVIAALARLIGRTPRMGDALPTVTLLIAAHNEESVIAAKLENSLAIDYPPERLEILVVADGCVDGTCAIVEGFADRGVRLLRQDPRQGKVSALNLAFPGAHGEIVVCTDANAMYRPDAIRKLVRHFADPEVGLVAGQKRILGEGGAAQGEGLYWRYEGFLKVMDSKVSSAMGATGEIFAIRKALWRSVPADTIIEDFVITMRLVMDGHRAIYDPEAVSEEEASPSVGEEFKRKVRIVAGGWQAIVRLWPLLLPHHGIVTFQYVSHRVLRWIVVPLMQPVMYVANAALAFHSPFYAALFAAHTAFYALALAGYELQRRGHRPKLFYLPFYFAFLNGSALLGAWRYFTRTQPVTWEKVKRSAAT